MHIREIRWGNIIGSTTKPEGWTVYATDFEFIIDNPDHYFGIPLSPEWLTKFGFTRNDVGEKFLDAIVWDHNQSSFRLVKYHGSNLPLYLEIGGKARRYVTEVHDLQNLYFAIESKELQISEP